MSQTWLQAELYPQVRRYRVIESAAPEIVLLDGSEQLSALFSSLLDAPYVLLEPSQIQGPLIELWSETACLARICPETGAIFVDGSSHAMLLDQGWGAAGWLAKQGFPETLERIETRAREAEEARRRALVQEGLHRRGNAQSLWREVVPRGLEQALSLVEMAGEKDSPNRLSSGELSERLESELERSFPEPGERARTLLSWLGLGYRDGHDLLLPHHLARVLNRLPGPLMQLADSPLSPALTRGFEVLLTRLPYDQGLNKSQRRKRKELQARFGWDGSQRPGGRPG